MSDPVEASALRTTALHSFHRAHHAKLVPFAGWEMPLYFSGILNEHTAVRTGVGMFDVGHMGILTVEGRSAAGLLSRRTTANIERLVPGQCRYTFWLDHDGEIVDDLVISRLDDAKALEHRFLVVPNAGRAEEIEQLLREHRAPDTLIGRHNDRATILAVQGPRSRELLHSELGVELADLAPFHGKFVPAAKGSVAAAPWGGRIPEDLSSRLFVSRTGYTGELGFELFLDREQAPAIAERLERAGVVPCGLGARDTLRMEKGFLLSGQDFQRDRSPLQAGQERFVDFDHPFVGRPALEAERARGVAVRWSGLSVSAPGAIPRHGTPVRDDRGEIAAVTSGGLSPTLGHGIALAYLPAALSAPGTTLSLQLPRGAVPAEVVRLPFVRAAR